METLISTESIDVQAAADNLMKFINLKQQQQQQQQQKEQKPTEHEQDSSSNASNHSNDLNEESLNDQSKQNILNDDVKTITTMINALTSSNCSSTSINSSSESNLSTSNFVEDLSKTLNMKEEAYDDFNSELVVTSSTSSSSSLSSMKRTHLKTLIYELYEIDETEGAEQQAAETIENPSVLVESYMEKLPPGKNLKNSLLLAWKKRYFKLNSLGTLYVYDLDDNGKPLSEPNEVYNLMGGRVEYEQNKVISLDDCRGNFLVVRCIQSLDSNDELYTAWKSALDSQIVDRCDLLWVKPSKLLSNNSTERKVLIVDIGTCSVRAGLYNNKPELPKLFCPTVCSKDKLNSGRSRVGFDAFDFLLSSSAPSTIDLHKLSLNCSNIPITFPLKTKGAIDKLNMDMESIESILNYTVENFRISCPDFEIIVITTHKLTDKVNVQFLNILLEKLQFKSAMILNQAIMALYSYHANVGIVASLGEKIDIIPICNGVPFQSGVTNLAYGGSVMSEFLNSFISRGHINYVNDVEQFLVRYIKEKSCYTAFNYVDELEKYDKVKYSIELTGQANEFKKIEFPHMARFKAVEGLFNPEIWGIDGQGIHKLIHKAIQSTSMDLRKEMARNIYLSGGMSRIPGLKERLEKELKQMFPPALKIQVNCSDYSYHCAYLGAFRFVQQPEYEKLLITRDEWLKESVNSLRKWRMF